VVTVFKDFHSTTFYPFLPLWSPTTSSNPLFLARVLSDYITIRVNGYTTEGTSGKQLQVWRQNFDRDMVPVYTSASLLWPCCNNHVYYFSVAAKHNTRTSHSVTEFGFQYFMEKFPPTASDDNIQLRKWHQDRHGPIFLLYYSSILNIWCFYVISSQGVSSSPEVTSLVKTWRLRSIIKFVWKFSTYRRFQVSTAEYFLILGEYTWTYDNQVQPT